jgi:hypothetical protein
MVPSKGRLTAEHVPWPELALLNGRTNGKIHAGLLRPQPRSALLLTHTPYLVEVF